MLHVDGVKYLNDFRLRIQFSTGVTKDVDLARELTGDIFAPLNDREFFSMAAVNPETQTVEWPNGADFAPEFLFEIGTVVEQVA